MQITCQDEGGGVSQWARGTDADVGVPRDHHPFGSRLTSVVHNTDL